MPWIQIISCRESDKIMFLCRGPSDFGLFTLLAEMTGDFLYFICMSYFFFYF